MRSLVCLTTALALAAPAAKAVTTFESGSLELLGGLIEDTADVSNGTFLFVVAPTGGISPPAVVGDGPDAATVRENSILALAEGEINGTTTTGDASTGGFAGGRGVVTTDTSDVTIIGGAVRGGDAPNTAFGGAGIDATSTGNVNVSGGTVEGGNGGAFGGSGITAVGSRVSIEGGAVSGGSGNSFGGEALSLFDLVSASITGGVLTGGDGGVFAGDAVLSIGAHPVRITGGTFTGGNGLSPGLALSAAGNSVFTILGGSFAEGTGSNAQDIAINASDDTVVNLRGGVFSNGLSLAVNAVLNVFGTGLAFDGMTVTGTLQSGEAIALPVTQLDPDTQVNLFEVVIPLPLPAALLLTGLAGLALAGRRGRDGS